MKTRKTVATVLACCMGASMLTACSGSSDSKSNTVINNSGVEVIDEVTDDIPWYTISETIIGEEFSGPEYDSVYTNMLATTDTGFVIKTTANLKIPNNIDWDNFNSADYYKEYLQFVNFNGDIVNTICLNDTYSQIDSNNFSVMTCGMYNGAVLITGSCYTENSYDVYNMLINPETDTTGEWVYNDGTNPLVSDTSSSHVRTQDGYSEGVYDLGSYSVDKYYIYDGNNGTASYVLYVDDANGNETELDLRRIMSGESVWDISGCLLIDDDTALIVANMGESYETRYLELDLANMTIGESEVDYSWLSNINFYNMVSFEGQGTFTMQSYGSTPGITKVDFDNQTTELVLGTNNANFNPEKYSALSIVDISDDRIILAGNVYEQTMGNSGTETFRIVTFTRADSNPNIGKTVVKVASLSTINYSIYESICQFNESSDSVYVVIDGRYSAENIDFSNAESGEDYNNTYNTGMTQIADQLTVDIIAGEGPDILFDAQSMTQLNNSDYLADLSGIADNNTDCFSNVFDACKTGDALYQMPLTISVQGITTYAEYVNDGQVGFTYDEFADFVSGPCNGTNPLYFGSKTDALTTLAATMSDVFVTGNGVNYDNEAFRSLAEYVNDNIVESLNDDDYDGQCIDFVGGNSGGQSVASSDGLYSFSSFLSSYGNRAADVRVLGYPSHDGRGPQFSVLSSVAVSAQASSVEACEEYVEFLIGADMQMLLAANSWANPVNRSIIVDTAETVIDNFNAEVDMYHEWMTDEELIMYGLPTEHVDAGVLDYYLGILDGCTSCSQQDIAINMIMSEEIQAYFAGQKTIDQVIDTMTNRINTYLSERG